MRKQTEYLRKFTYVARRNPSAQLPSAAPQVLRREDLIRRMAPGDG